MSLASQRYPQNSELYFLAKMRSTLHTKIKAVRQAQQFIRIVTQQKNESYQSIEDYQSSLEMSQTSQSAGKHLSTPPSQKGHESSRFRSLNRTVSEDITEGLASLSAVVAVGQSRRKTLPLSSVAYAQKMSKERFSLNSKLPDINLNASSRLSQSEALLRIRSRRPRRPELGRKFKAAAWISIIIRRLCLANLRNSEDSDSPYMKNIKFVDNMVKESESNLLFNAEAYKANRELRMSEISKHILIKPRWARTEQELLHVEIALRSIKDYADYPVAIQRKVAEVGEYVKYESRRIIVREGHPAWNFYFILSGSVVVLVMDEDRRFVQPKAILKRGQSFGELAIIHGDKRRSTIVAMEDTEMLSIWYEDYEAIFMDGGVLKSEDSFITNLSFLQGWPIQIADANADLFRYHFYKRGDILVRDSNRSSWIIVVKSGSLDVLKRLKKVKPFGWRKQNQSQQKPSQKDVLPPVDLGALLEGFDLPILNGAGTLMVKRLTEKKVDFNSKKTSKKQPQKSKESKQKPSAEVTLKGLREIGTLDTESFKQEILTASNELDKSYDIDLDETAINCNPMFVHIQTLTKGQVFGLYELVLGQQPSFCVVSNGAEVIMIDKELYMEHINDTILKRIRSEAQAYPSDEELQESLQVTVDWDAYKMATLKSAVQKTNNSTI